MVFIQTDYGMNESSWLILGIFSLTFHTLISIPILTWTIHTVWQHQHETFFKSRKKLLIKIILIYSVFMITILRPIELIIGPLRSIIFRQTKIPEFVVSWIAFITMNTSSFIVIQLYVLRAWIYFFNIQSVLALQDKLWQQTLYSTSYDNWYLKHANTYGNVKFCSKIISIFSAIFLIILCIIRIVDSHSKGYIGSTFAFQCALIILLIILSVVVANIYSFNDLFALRNELKFDLIILITVFILLCCITILFWNHYQLIWFTFLELTSLLQLIQSIMPSFWYYKILKKNRKKILNQKKSKESYSNHTKSPVSISSISPCSSPVSNSNSINANKLKVWWLNNISNSNKLKTPKFNPMEQLYNQSKNVSNSREHSKSTTLPIKPKSLKFEQVVSDARGFREFIKFLSLSFSSENMLFIAEVMRFKNFMWMRGLVNFEDIGYYLDLPSNVIDYMWYIPEEYRNINNARKAKKKRKSLLHKSNHKRKSFSIALSKQKSTDLRDSMSLAALRPKSCPAANTKPNESKFGFDSVPATVVNNNGKESKHKRRVQWMNKQKQKKQKRKGVSDTKNKKNTMGKEMEDDLGVMSDIDMDNSDDDVIIEMLSDNDEHSVSLKDTPKITAMISPKLLETAINNNGTQSGTATPVLSPTNSIRLQLNEIDISDLNDADAELTANEFDSPKSYRDNELKINDFFEGFDNEQINAILITPLEDAQRIRDRYIINGAEFQVNLSGGAQYETLQYFENDPKNINWKERKRSIQCDGHGNNIKPLETNHVPLSLTNVPTDTGDSVTNTTLAVTGINIMNPSINLEEIEEKGQLAITNMDNGVKIENIILRFDNACDAIIKQLLYHEFHRFKLTNDYRKYFKYYQKSRKRLGSIYKKFQKKTSRVLPMNNHQSPQLTSMKQLSLHKQRSERSHNSPRLTPLTMKKAKSVSLMRDNLYHQYTNSLTTQQRSSANISKISMRHAAISSNTLGASRKRHSLELSGNMSTTISGIFTLLNAPNSRISTTPSNSKNNTPVTTTVTGIDMEVVMEDININGGKDIEKPVPIMTHTKDATITSIGSKSNKLSLIRETPQSDQVENDKNKTDVITPIQIIQYKFSDIEIEVSDDENEQHGLENDEEKNIMKDNDNKMENSVDEMDEQDELGEFKL